MSISTRLRVVTTCVGHGPCPTPYPIRCRPYAQSHMPGSDMWIILISTNTARRIPSRSYASTRSSNLRLAASCSPSSTATRVTTRSLSRKKNQIKTVFITPFGAYAYTTMSFGLKNAGATYQRAIQLCLADQLHRNIEAYVDDVVIKTRSHDEFICDLKETFNSLRKF
jgi:hypothetical protein